MRPEEPMVELEDGRLIPRRKAVRKLQTVEQQGHKFLVGSTTAYAILEDGSIRRQYPKLGKAAKRAAKREKVCMMKASKTE
jgi:hypothetical protein